MPGTDSVKSDSMQWFTTFYYEEELRSMLFNGVFNSGFKPGIYNAKIGLYTVGADTGSSDSMVYSGLHLYIGKGTTFVFSNRYTHDGRYHQDLTTPGSYIIKSTAANDLDIPLIRLGQFKTTGADLVMGEVDRKAYPVEKFYVVATLIYDEEENLMAPHPEIRIAIDNPSFVNPASQENDDLNYYYNYIDTGFSYYIPDGSVNYERGSEDTSLVDYTEIMGNMCYLTIGEVIDTNSIGALEEERICYLKGSNWNDDGMNGQGTASEVWMRNHTFVGRGFPAYRQNYIANKANFSPELIPYHNLDRLYLDINNIYDGDILYNTSLNDLFGGSEQSFEGPLGIAKAKYEEGLAEDKATRFNSFKLDFDCKGPSESEDLDTFESETYGSVQDIIEDINNNYIKDNPDHDFLTAKYLLISDILFLTTCHRYSYLPDISIENIFTADNINHSKLKVVPFRWYSVLDNTETSNLFNPSTTNDTVESGEAGNIYNLPGFNLGAGLEGTKILPLDVSEPNLDRLYRIIANKNIIPAIIDYLRQHPEKSPYLNPQDATSLVPAAIIFRKVKIETDGVKITGLKPVDDISEITKDGKPGRFNPANILSFFDMEYKTNRLNPINFKANDIYSVLPVLD